jgi:hypothetical protein
VCFIDSDLSELLSLIIPSNSIGHWAEESQGRSRRDQAAIAFKGMEKS